MIKLAEVHEQVDAIEKICAPLIPNIFMTNFVTAVGIIGELSEECNKKS